MRPELVAKAPVIHQVSVAPGAQKLSEHGTWPLDGKELEAVSVKVVRQHCFVFAPLNVERQIVDLGRRIQVSEDVNKGNGRLVDN